MAPKPIRVAIDTNILEILAVAQKTDKEFFLNHFRTMKDAELLFYAANWLQSQLDQRKIELVITKTIDREIVKFNAAMKTKHKKQLKNKFKGDPSSVLSPNLLRVYTADCKAIKYVSIEGCDHKLIKKLKLKLATSYTEKDEFYAFHDELEGKRTKPFLTAKDGSLSNDSLIMAEATLLGLDFITLDKHFLATNTVVGDLPLTIQRINKQELGTTVRPFSFWEFMEKLNNPNKLFKKHKPILHGFHYLNYGALMREIEKRKHPEIVLERQQKKLYKRMNLCGCFLEKPLDLNSLTNQNHEEKENALS